MMFPHFSVKCVIRFTINNRRCGIVSTIISGIIAEGSIASILWYLDLWSGSRVQISAMVVPSRSHSAQWKDYNTFASKVNVCVVFCFVYKLFKKLVLLCLYNSHHPPSTYPYLPSPIQPLPPFSLFLVVTLLSSHL